MDKMCVLCVFCLSSNTSGEKCNILFILFPQVVQKHTMGEVGN